jgi:hypothetical protein
MNGNKLKKVNDESTIMSLLSSAKEGSFEVYIWRLIGDSKHVAHVKIESIRKSRGDFSIAPMDLADRKVQELIGSQNFIDLYIPDSALLLRCSIKQTDAPHRYYLHLPEFVAQVERRKSFRVNVHETSEVRLNFNKAIPFPRHMTQQFNKNCFDISTGGFSFFVSRMESKFFKVNDPIRSVVVQIGNWTTKINAEVALIKEVEPDEYNGLTYKVWRVCCRFNQIDQISKKYLEKFVFERLKEEVHAINS